ncbi:MAG: chorismate synthase [Clostridia bacterium]|nr:chorismate synthase [Clostridia bacterium]
MGAVFGKNIQFTIFGESHGPAIGGVISSVPHGVKLDFPYIDMFLKRRNHKALYTTKRQEADNYEILSGVKDGVTTGAPLAFIIRNGDTRGKDYSELENLVRPGHSDYPAFIKYNGFNDVSGGGHFSGRLTAPLTFAGSVARQILRDKGIEIYSYVVSVGNTKCPTDTDDVKEMQKADFPVADETYKEKFMEVIESAAKEGDSVGGVIKCVIKNVPAGVGEPFFHSVESEIAKMMFSIPAVKGVEFGKGFEITRMSGSEANDCYEVKDGEIKTVTNNNGGVTGGITNGSDVVFSVAIKPTPSIFKPQQTVNVDTKTNEVLQLKGRHDSCIVPRATVAVESGAALVVLDLLGGK